MKTQKKVRYIGPISYLEDDYKVLKTVRPGEAIGNGETNISAENLLVCEAVDQGTPGHYLFLEHEVQPVK